MKKNGKNPTNSSTSGTKPKRTRKTVPRDSPPQRSSIYRGVTRHRWTGRYEAHLWDKNCWNESQSKKGRQVYLGAYDDEEAAAHAYDLAALKYWGQETILNFPLSTYEKELRGMEGTSREEYIGSLRRKSSGFSRGVSKYRGVASKAIARYGQKGVGGGGHHHNGRWEARIGRVFGNKYLYLGTYVSWVDQPTLTIPSSSNSNCLAKATQEEAAIAYDMAAIEYRGLNAVTNFDLSRYIKWLKPNSNNTNSLNPNLEPNLNAPTNPNHEFGLSFDHHNQDSSMVIDVGPGPTPSRPTTATTALGLLLQSSKFKEMMEMTSTTQCPASPQESFPPECSFPNDVQTHFEAEDFGLYGEGDDAIFGELNSFMFDG